MKETKLRFWDKKNKKFIDYMNLFIGINGITEIENSNNDILKKEDIEVMQFTGLKDKNGKEIYEGDIVEYKSRVSYIDEINMPKCTEKGLIVWKNFSFKIDMRDPTYEDERFYSISQKEIEVIGNKFEDKDLLKK